MAAGIIEHYHKLARDAEIEADPAQIEAAERLDALATVLDSWRPSRSAFFSIFGRRGGEAPRGIYLHGAVGRGKTMLMDLFFAHVRFKPKRRIHFHELMAEVHDRIGLARKTVDGDPIPHVATSIAADAGLLCFDEFHVTDIADAMILGRLFKTLWEQQVVVVATSNAHPTGLYKNGLNRQLFLPFLELLQRNMEVIELVAAKDYRLEKLAGQRLYFTPADAVAHTEVDRLWARLTGHHPPEAIDIEVKGRILHVPASAMGAARFDFADLCDKPLGALDYLHLAHTFHTLVIENIPVLPPNRRDVARRFINLIDTLYDNRVCLVASAAAEPDDLYPKGDGSDLFERTASRLIEMRSEQYLTERSRRGAAETLASEAPPAGP